MPRAEEPRTMVRWSVSDFAVVEAAAAACGVAVGALVRECAVRSAAQVARDVSEGRITLRRRSSRSSERGAAAAESSSSPVDAAPLSRHDAGVERALAFRRAMGGG